MARKAKDPKAPKEIIRSTRTSLKFSNTHRTNDLHVFIKEYRNVVEYFVDYFWSLGEKAKILSLPPEEVTSLVSTWMTSGAIQSAAKQASGIVRGTRKKQKRRLAQIIKFNSLGMFKKARKLQKTYDEAKVTKPNIKEVCPELDSRFISIDMYNKTSFDGWVTLTCLGNKLKIILPFKKTKHFNKMLGRGKLKNGARISKKSITFNFSLPPIPKKVEGVVVGLDKGATDVYFMSDHQKSCKDIHGWDLDNIIKKMSRQKKGSRAFAKSQEHRKNYIHWCLNQIDLSNIKTLNIEKLKNMRKDKRTSKYLSRWTYTIIDDKLLDLALEHGVHVKELNPVYTSQRCSKCGWTCKANRKGKKFVCIACGFTCDADYNASLNLSFDLPEISKVEQLKHKNKNGFYWNVLGKEPIVPSVQEA